MPEHQHTVYGNTLTVFTKSHDTEISRSSAEKQHSIIVHATCFLLEDQRIAGHSYDTILHQNM